jgi:hypothetical protein
MDFKYLITVTRPRVYLLWMILLPIGWVATHFYRHHEINALWTLIAVIGLGYMYKVLYLKVAQMRRILLSWVIPIVLGLSVSGAVFYIDTSSAAWLMGHLGAFWLAVMAIGYFFNGVYDPPRFWYFFNAIINVSASALCFTMTEFEIDQYLVAAIVSGWSMLNLWLFRADV